MYHGGRSFWDSTDVFSPRPKRPTLPPRYTIYYSLKRAETSGLDLRNYEPNWLDRYGRSSSFISACNKTTLASDSKTSQVSCPSCSESLDQGFYLPLHAMVKRSSLTTKIRIVFDGSAKTSTGISLNYSLRVGPTIQEDLFSIVTRFRFFRYALTADIEQMYRQIRVS